MLRKEILADLYNTKRLSMVDVARALAITPATVKYWMDRYHLKRRSSSESAYVKQNPDGDPFKIKEQLTKRDRELMLCCLMLYWAEGSRRNKHVTQIANLDCRLLLLFVKFLKQVCGVRENKICLTVQLHKQFDKERTKNYWFKTLGIPRNFIKVNTHLDKRSIPDKQWSRYGIARIEVRNVKLKQWIDKELERQIALWI